MAPRREVRLDPRLEAGEPKLLQAADLGLREGLVGELGQRLAAPERKRLALLARGGQPLESGEVELVLLDAQQVARRARLDTLLAERLAELGDVDLERLPPALRCLLVPECIDQAIGRHDLVGM